jgi:hypothetical protein
MKSEKTIQEPGRLRYCIANGRGNDLIISVLPRAPQALPESVVLDLEPDSAHNNTQNPMQSYPVAQPQTQTQVPTKLAVVSQPEAPKSIKLSQSYFSNEKNPRLAYMEACSQQAAHFNELLITTVRQ